MTTITIERELLVRIEKELFLARNYGGTLRDEPLLKKVSAVLALASEFDSIIEAIGDDPAPATAPAWHDAQQAEIESLRWTVMDALESLDNGMTADCRATLSSATKETP